MLYFQHLKESTWFCLECSVSSVKPILCCTYVINGANTTFCTFLNLFFLSCPGLILSFSALPSLSPRPCSPGQPPPFRLYSHRCPCRHSFTRQLCLDGCVFLVVYKSPVCAVAGSRPLRHGGGEVPYLPSRCCSLIT